MLVRFSCGCVGIPNRKQGESSIFSEPLILQSCDGEFDYCASFRNLTGADGKEKTWKALSRAETIDFFSGLNRLLGDGYKYRDIKRLLEG